MKIGYLYQKDEKELQKDIEKGLDISLGIDVNDLYDQINVWQIENVSRDDIVIALLKQEIMQLLGKIIVKNETLE